MGVSIWRAGVCEIKTGSRLTKAQKPASAVILVFFHHMLLLRPFALLLNAKLWLAASPVLSMRSSILSPRERICSTFCVMISLTAPSSAWAALTGSDCGESEKRWRREARTGWKAEKSATAGAESCSCED